MKIRDILYFLDSGTRLIVNRRLICEEKSVSIYDDEAGMLPYWIADMNISPECMEAEGDAIVIHATPLTKGERNNKNNQAAINALSEENVLLFLAGFLCHYDAGIIHDERFCSDEWERVFSPMIDYVEKRIGGMAFDEKMAAWYRANSFRSGSF